MICVDCARAADYADGRLVIPDEANIPDRALQGVRQMIKLGHQRCQSNEQEHGTTWCDCQHREKAMAA